MLTRSERTKTVLARITIISIDLFVLIVLTAECMFLYLLVALTLAQWKGLLDKANYIASVVRAYIMSIAIAEYLNRATQLTRR